MHRVVTKVMDTQNGVRKRHIDLGPWQPSKATALRWAAYLERTGRYDSVTIQSNGQSQDTEESGQSLPEDDLFLDAEN
jgi:hypothetical protein